MQAREWGVTGDRGILFAIDLVNTKMMSGNFDAQIFIDPTTGLPPTMATTAGTFHYTLPANVRKLACVMFEALDAGDTYDRYGQYEQIIFNGVQYHISPGTARPATPTQAVTFTFRSDPGTHTDRYLTKYWIDPTRIASVYIQPDVPSKYHDLLVDGVLARIQPVQYGKQNPWLEWLERMKLEFWGEMNYNPPQRSLSPMRF
jgi:hypothetical protein